MPRNNTPYNWGYRNAAKQMADGGAVKPIKIKPENKGKLHKALNVPAAKKIPAAKIAKAVKSSNPTLRKQAQFAKNAAGWNKKG